MAAAGRFGRRAGGAGPPWGGALLLLALLLLGGAPAPALARPHAAPAVRPRLEAVEHCRRSSPWSRDQWQACEVELYLEVPALGTRFGPLDFLVGLRVMPETASLALWGGPANSTLGLAVLTRENHWKACADVSGLGKALNLCLGVDDLAFRTTGLLQRTTGQLYLSAEFLGVPVSKLPMDELDVRWLSAEARWLLGLGLALTVLMAAARAVVFLRQGPRRRGAHAAAPEPGPTEGTHLLAPGPPGKVAA